MQDLVLTLRPARRFQIDLNVNVLTFLSSAVENAILNCSFTVDGSVLPSESGKGTTMIRTAFLIVDEINEKSFAAGLSPTTLGTSSLPDLEAVKRHVSSSSPGLISVSCCYGDFLLPRLSQLSHSGLIFRNGNDNGRLFC